MNDLLPLTIGAYEYDTTRALFEGGVGVEGAEVTMATAPVLPQIFAGLVQEHAYDVAELGLTFYLRALDVDDSLVAIPAFPNRVFRHSCVFVHRGSGITGPHDLVDKTLGEFGIYGQYSGVWAKGILDVSPVPDGTTLSHMLRDGQIDALFSANMPQPMLDDDPDVVRLFPDYEQRERDYFRRTHIFPIMHTVAAPRAVFEQHPGLATRVYRAFLAAKDAAAERYRRERRLQKVPQGLTRHRRTVDELFVPELLDT